MKTLCIVSMFFLLISFPIFAQAQTDNKALFEKKCSICHKVDRATSKKKASQEWQATVMRMKTVNGAPINDDEAKRIIDYLSKNYGK